MSKFGNLTSDHRDWKVTTVCIPIPRKDIAKEFSNYCPIVLIDMLVRLRSKSFKLGFSSM